jgi:hypothetical protein
LEESGDVLSEVKGSVDSEGESDVASGVDSKRGFASRESVERDEAFDLFRRRGGLCGVGGALAVRATSLADLAELAEAADLGPSCRKSNFASRALGLKAAPPCGEGGF